MESLALNDRRILVTGAASGIGRAIAELFSAQGARVALLDREPAVMEVTRSVQGGIGFNVDVTDEAAVTDAVASSAARLGGIDGVVNAAGVDLVAAIGETPLAQWNRVLAVNVTGPFLVCRAAVPWLRAASQATVVNIASGAGLRPLARRTAYCASKAALVMFGRALSMEVAPTVRVNTICPGIIDTPMFRASYESAPDPNAEFMRILDRYLIKRVGAPSEIAQAALFLTSPASSFMTGATMAVDGGRTFH